MIRVGGRRVAVAMAVVLRYTDTTRIPRDIWGNIALNVSQNMGEWRLPTNSSFPPFFADGNFSQNVSGNTSQNVSQNMGEWWLPTNSSFPPFFADGNFSHNVSGNSQNMGEEWLPTNSTFPPFLHNVSGNTSLNVSQKMDEWLLPTNSPPFFADGNVVQNISQNISGNNAPESCSHAVKFVDTQLESFRACQTLTCSCGLGETILEDAHSWPDCVWRQEAVDRLTSFVSDHCSFSEQCQHAIALMQELEAECGRDDVACVCSKLGPILTSGQSCPDDDEFADTRNRLVSLQSEICNTDDGSHEDDGHQEDVEEDHVEEDHSEEDDEIEDISVTDHQE